MKYYNKIIISISNKVEKGGDSGAARNFRKGGGGGGIIFTIFLTLILNVSPNTL